MQQGYCIISLPSGLIEGRRVKRALLAGEDTGENYGAENIGTLTDEAAATFSELFGEDMEAAKSGSDEGVEKMAGAEDETRKHHHNTQHADSFTAAADWQDR